MIEPVPGAALMGSLKMSGDRQYLVKMPWMVDQ